MAARKRRTRKTAQTLEQQVRDEIFWTIATIALIGATVIFVPILFGAIK